MSRPHGRRPPYTRRARIGFTCAAAMVVHGALLAAAAVTVSAPAHSTPPSTDQQAFEYWAHHGSSVCRALDLEPTVDGIVIAALDIYTHTSLNTAQAGQVIQLAIHYTCPRHQDLIDQYNASQARQRRGVMA